MHWDGRTVQIGMKEASGILYLNSAVQIKKGLFKKIKRKTGDFPGGAVVGNPPAGAGDTGSSPGPGGSRMPRSGWARAPQLLSLRSGAPEPQLLKPIHPDPVLHNMRSHGNERPARRDEEWPPLAAARESPHAATKTQRSQK